MPTPPAAPPRTADEAPPCKTRLCAELGIRAIDRWGYCADCSAAQAENAAEAQAEGRREARRLGEW